MFKKGQEVEIILSGKVEGKLFVVSDQRNEIVLLDKHGTEISFAYYKEYGGWKMLFNSPSGGRCFSERGPTYDIQKCKTKRRRVP